MMLFVFEDIVKLDDRSIQLILKEVDSKDLAIALRGVPSTVRTIRLASAARTRSATWAPPVRSVPGRMSRNSSPPQRPARSTSRSVSWRSKAKSRKRESPAGWP